jgi:hypothetical protein
MADRGTFTFASDALGFADLEQYFPDHRGE